MVDNSLTHPLVYKWTPSRPVSTGSHDVPQVANRDAMDRFQDLHLGIFKHFKKACFMRERRDYKPSLAAGVESPNMTLPELFPGCRSPWAGYPDAVGYLGPVTQKDTGSWSHSHCIAYGKHCFSPCGCCTSCCLSSETHPEKSCFSDFQPVPSHFLPSSIASHHLTLFSSPLFTADDLELSFPQPKIYLDAKAEDPDVQFVFAAGLRQGFFIHRPFSRHRLLSPFSLLSLRSRFHGRP